MAGVQQVSLRLRNVLARNLGRRPRVPPLLEVPRQFRQLARAPEPQHPSPRMELQSNQSSNGGLAAPLSAALLAPVRAPYAMQAPASSPVPQLVQKTIKASQYSSGSFEYDFLHENRIRDKLKTNHSNIGYM